MYICRLQLQIVTNFAWFHDVFNCVLFSFQGIQLYLNGSAAQQNEYPKKEVVFERPQYGRGWALGRPNSILKLVSSFGNFGIAHLAQWQRELVGVEIKAAFIDTLLPDKKEAELEMHFTSKI